MVRRKTHSMKVKKAISDLSNSDLTFWNRYKVSDYALAAQDLLGYGKYEGDREEVIALISCGLCFETEYLPEMV